MISRRGKQTKLSRKINRENSATAAVKQTGVCRTARSHVIRVRPDDCRLVANNPGSFANNVGLAPRIDANIPGPKSRCLQAELRMIAGRYTYPTLAPIIDSRVNMTLLENAWSDTLRFAASVKAGTIPAALAMKRLAAWPRQNLIAGGMREYLRSRVEAKMRCLKAFGERIAARDPDRQTAEVHIRIALMNRFSALGTAEIQRVS